MTDVSLTDSEGNPLQLKSDSPSQLTFPIPEGMKNNPPPSIPLWSFDEEKGIWVEEGEATLQGDVYIGPAKHFSWVNLDVPTARVTIKGKVTDCAGKPVPYLKVRAWQSAASTNSTGAYVIYVPALTDVTVHTDVQGGTSRELPGQPPGAVVEGVDLSVPCGIGLGGGIVGTQTETDKGSVQWLLTTGQLLVATFDGQRVRVDMFPESEGQGGSNHEIVLADRNTQAYALYARGTWSDTTLDELQNTLNDAIGLIGGQDFQKMRETIEEQFRLGHIDEERRREALEQIELLENLLGGGISFSGAFDFTKPEMYKLNEAQLLSQGFQKLSPQVINGYLCNFYSGTVNGCVQRQASWNGLIMLFENACEDTAIVGQAATLEFPSRAFEKATLRVDWLP